MIDLYYWPTPNGHKITTFLEEAGLLERHAARRAAVLRVLPDRYGMRRGPRRLHLQHRHSRRAALKPESPTARGRSHGSAARRR